MPQAATDEVFLVGELFTELIEKYNKVQNKKHLYKELKELTITEINTIFVIGRNSMKSMSEIANRLGVSFGTPTVTIDRLIAKGYVERLRDEEDRRQVFVRLSEKGGRIYSSIEELKNKVADRIFGILTPQEREGLISTLSKLNSKFDELFSTME